MNNANTRKGVIDPRSGSIVSNDQGQPIGPDGQVVGGGFIEAGVIGGLSLRRRATMHDVHNAATPEAALNALNAYMDTSNDAAAATAGTAFQNIVFVDPTASSGGAGTRASPVNTLPSSLAANTAYFCRGGTTITPTQRLAVNGTATGGNDAAGAAIRVANSYLGSYDSDLFGKAVLDFTSTPMAATTSRAIEVNAENFTLADVVIRPSLVPTSTVAAPITSVRAVSVNNVSNGFRCVGTVFDLPVEDGRPTVAVALNGPSFFTVDGIETTGLWMNPVSVAAVNAALMAAETRRSRITRSILRCGTMVPALFPDSDCLTMGGDVITDWRRLLTISYNKYLGARENAEDRGAHSNVISLFNEALEPYEGSASLAAFLMGTSNASGLRSTGGIWIGNIVKGWKTAGATAFSSRGGKDILMMGNIVDDCHRAVFNGTTDSGGMRIIHNNFTNIGGGGVLMVRDGNGNGRFLNNICQTSSFVYEFGLTGQGGAGWRHGGNLIVGGIARDRTLAGFPNASTPILPDHWFASLDQMIDLHTYEPTRAAMLKQTVPLNVPVLDALLSGYRFPCAGAVAPAQVW